MASVNDIASSISAEIDKQVEARLKAIMEKGDKDKWIAYMRSEIEHWRQRCQELEIELECIRNAFPEHDNEILPKHVGLF